MLRSHPAVLTFLSFVLASLSCTSTTPLLDSGSPPGDLGAKEVASGAGDGKTPAREAGKPDAVLPAPSISVVGDNLAPALQQRAMEIARTMFEALLAKMPELKAAFAGVELRLRIVGKTQKFSEMPEAGCWPFSLVPYDQAYGATCPGEATDLTGASYRTLFARDSDWVEITLIHELTHMIHFVTRDAGFVVLDKQIQDAAAGATVDVDGSASHYNENLAYKAQYILCGSGGFLETASDPIVPLVDSMFGGPLFPELKPKADALLSYQGL